ncbi:hypothetical protein PMIN01_10741 [Paraphaeosphaeria minitans]|uniref:Uncharacterized protein n=1 Tax=Paraphaeosphaeria minitans TaxID=565426 RepID=A0A9P6KMP8_9PLEO|nr:hypothetical protein PMIN01_10741 [Paraphaeosphaeria minitans]
MHCPGLGVETLRAVFGLTLFVSIRIM